jgi:hypothetical protein
MSKYSEDNTHQAVEVVVLATHGLLGTVRTTCDTAMYENRLSVTALERLDTVKLTRR